MRVLAAILYFCFGVVQFLATISGIQEFFGLSGPVAWIIGNLGGLFLAWIPIVGTVSGIYGAVAAWGWPIWQAVAIFIGPLVVCLTFVAIAEFVERVGERQ